MSDESLHAQPNTELIAELAALRAQVAELTAGENRRRLYLEGALACAPDAIVALDAEHHILEWNQGAEKLFGYSSDEAIGRDLDDLIAVHDPAMLRQAHSFTSQILSQKPVPPIETVRFHKNGTPLDVLMAASPILIDGVLGGLVAVYSDITARKQAEQHIKRHSRYLETLQAVNATLRSTLPLQEVLDMIVRGAGETLGYPGVLIVLPDDSGQRLRLGAAWGRRFQESALRLLNRDLKQLSLPLTLIDNPMARAFLSGEMETWSGSPEHVVLGVEPPVPPEFPVAMRRKMHTSLAIYAPLCIGDRTVGVLIAFSPRRSLEDAERAMLLGLADQAGLAIETARRFEETEHLKALNEYIVQSMAEGIAVEDEAGRFVFVNAAALAMLGYSVEEMLGRHRSMLFPPDQLPIVDAADERRLRGQSDRYQVDLVRKDGTRLPILVSGSPRFDAAGRFIGTLAVFSDISARVRAEEAMARRAREMSALYETSLAINSQRDLSSLLATIIERSADLLGQQMAALFLVRPDGEILEMVVSYRMPGDFVGTTLRPGEGLAGRVMQTGQPQMVADYRHWEGQAPVFAAAPFGAMLAVPLKVKEKVIGVVTVTGDQEPGLFSEDQVRLASLFADQAAIAIENARLIAESQRRAQELAGLYETAITTSAVLDTDVLLARVYDQLRRIFAPDAALIGLYDSAASEIELVLAMEGGRLGVHTSHAPVPLHEAGLLGWIVRSGQSLLVGDLETEPLPVTPKIRGQPTRSWLGAPLISRERIIGAISLQSFKPRVFDRDHLRLLESLASQVAIAIDNARLYEQAQQRLHALTVLFDASAAVSTLLDADRVLDTTARTITAALGAEGCAISIWNREKDTLVTLFDFTGGAGGHDSPGTAYHLADYPASRNVLLTRQPLQVQVDDPAADRAELTFMRAQGIKSLLMIPLIVHDEVIGTVELVEYVRRRVYEPAEISLSQTLANQMAAALENARLFEAEHAFRERAEALRQAAQAVGASLEVDEILRLILDRLRHVLTYDTASVLVYRESHSLELVAGAGYRDEQSTSHEAAHRLPESPILRRMAIDLQPIVCDDVRDLEGWIWVPGAEHVRSWLGIPLVAQGRMIGALMADHTEIGFFKEADVQIAQALAQHAAQAIEHAHLFQAERKQRALAEALRRATAAVSSTLDLEQVLDRILEQVSGVFGGDASNIMLIDDGLAHFVRWLGYDRFGPEEQTRDIALRVADIPTFRRMYETGRPLVIPDTAADPEWVRIPQTAWVRSHAAAPIRVRDRVIGFLVVDSAAPGFFDLSQADPLQAFADSASMAVANARLYAETVRRNRELALLNRVIAASAASQEIGPILDMVCRELATALGLPRAGAVLLDEERGIALIAAEYPTVDQGQQLPAGVSSALGSTYLAGAQPVMQHIADHQSPLVISQPQTDERLAPIDHLFRESNVATLLVLPLIIEGRSIGAIGLAAVEPREFTQEEIDLAWHVTSQAASALARARLAEAQQRLSIAVEQAAESVLITDPAGKILYVNPAFEQVTGYSQAEVIGHTPRILKSGRQDSAFYDQLWQTLKADQVWQGQFINKKKDGSLYTETATISPVHNQAGEIVNYVAVKRDVTREVQLEDQFRQAQKMEAMGRLAGGIAHDFNNLLTVIQVSAWLLQRQIRPEDPLWEYVHRIEDTVERATNLIKQLLSFSRRQIIEPQTLNLNQVVSDMGRMLQRVIGEDVHLVTALSSELWPVHVDPSQMEQVIMNLAINARDAMPNGGTLTIETANVVLDESYTADHIGARPGEHVLLSIADTGVGMDDEVKLHLFEPFFTTKTRGQGTGLGLSTVFGIVNQSQGHIWVISSPGQGAAFQIYLPHASGAQPVAAARTIPVLADGRGTETILVVEDEDAVRELIVRVLMAHGYQILASGNGADALGLSKQHAGPIHLLLTDVIMPNMNGRELAERLQSQRPGTRVLFMSGYTDDAIMQQGLLAPSTALIQKPFSLEVLIHRVRSVLGAR